MAGRKLADSVSVDTAYTVEPHRFNWFAPPVATIVALDLGIKSMTPQRFAERGVRVHVLPANATLGTSTPTTPTACSSPTAPVTRQPLMSRLSCCRGVLRKGTPFFGICFGNQLLGRALGFGTYKLPFGPPRSTSRSWTRPPARLKSPHRTTASLWTPHRRYVTAPNAEFGEVIGLPHRPERQRGGGLTCKDIRPSRFSTTPKPPRVRTTRLPL